MAEPLRAAPVLAGSVTVNLPLALAVAPADMLAHDGATTVQVHVPYEVSVPVSVPAAAVNELLLKVKVGAEGQGWPSWVMVKVEYWPMATIWPEPLREAGSVLAWT